MEQQTTFIPDGMNAFERNVKRIGDCIIAGILLIIFSPLFFLKSLNIVSLATTNILYLVSAYQI